MRQLTRYQSEVEDLLGGDLDVLGIERGDFTRSLELQRQHGLLTNDSLHLAAGLRAGLRLIATNDPPFNPVPDITIFKPDDVT